MTDVTQFDIQHLVGYGENVSGESFGFSHGPNNTIRNYYWGNETNFIQFLKFGMWFHIAATYDPTSATEKGKLFINGKLVSTSNISINTNGTDKKIYIGRTSLSGLTSDKGFQLDDLKIYNTALTNQQVFNDYHGANTTSYPTNNLLAYFNFENNLNSHNGTYKFQEASNNNIPYVNAINGNGVSFQQSYTLMNRDGISGSANLSNDLGNTEFTIAFWHYTDNITGTVPYPTLFEMNERLYYRHQELSTNLRDEWGWLMSNNIWASRDVGFGIGGWHHIAIVHKASGSNLVGMKVYFDGVDYGMNTAGYNVLPLITTTLKSIYLGGGTSSNGTVLANNKRFNGKIDEAFFYNRALTQAEIIQLKNYRTFTCPTGNVTLSTQAEVDALASCTTISGNLTVNGGGNALNLAPLNNITSITGTLFITGLSNNQVNIFPNLTTVGNAIAIQNNTFQQFSGFNSFTTLTAGTLQFLNNSQLQTISGFNSLISLTSGGNLGFVGNSNLETINAFSNLQTINGLLIRNTKLTNINFLTSLNTNNGQLSIESNPLLTNATFPNMVNHNFSNGTTGVRYIRFINNILLTAIGNINFNGSSNCESLLIQSSPLLDTITNLNSTSNFYVVGIVQITGTALQNLSFLQGLTECIGLTLSNNSSLQNLNGLSNLTGIGGNINISNNPQLSNLNGLNTTSINLYNNSVTINNCENLNNINALSVIPISSISSLTITNNSQLAMCASTWLCDYVATGKPLTVTGNATGCESVAAINIACAILSNSDFDLASISLFPNPTDAIFSIEVPNEVVKQVRIFDVTGKMLLDSNQSTLNVSSFASGIYMINIETESGKTGVSKLVKK